MGINIEMMDGEKLQLVHYSATAYSEQLGVEGVIFMKEITEHAKQIAQGTKFCEIVYFLRRLKAF